MCSHGNNNGWVYFELGLTMYVRMYHTHVYTYDTYIYEQYLCLCLYISVSEYISVVVSVSIPTSTCLHARAGAFSLSLSLTHTQRHNHTDTCMSRARILCCASRSGSNTPPRCARRAISSAVSSPWFRSDASAPTPSKKSTMARLPRCAAMCRGVSPAWSAQVSKQTY